MQTVKVPEPRQLPSGSWFIQLRLGGESIPVTEPSRTACIAAARLIKAEYLAGREVRKKNLPPASGLTLRELLDRYIGKYKAVLSPSSVRGYCCIRDNRFAAYMDRRIGEISDWQRLINDEARKCAPKTVRCAWGLVRAALADAKQPVPDVVLPKLQGREHPFLSADEIRRLVSAVRGSPYEIPILLGLHGLRRSEIAALTWKQVDLKAGMIRVEGALVPDENGKYVHKKTNKSEAGRRTVPIMIPELRAALENVSESDRVGPVVKCHINTIYKAVNRICEREGLPPVGAHGLRHSFASLGHFVGVPEHEMQILGGWKDPGTMRKIYEHVEKAAMLRAQNAMAAFYAHPDQNANADANTKPAND